MRVRISNKICFYFWCLECGISSRVFKQLMLWCNNISKKQSHFRNPIYIIVICETCQEDISEMLANILGLLLYISQMFEPLSLQVVLHVAIDVELWSARGWLRNICSHKETPQHRHNKQVQRKVMPFSPVEASSTHWQPTNFKLTLTSGRQADFDEEFEKKQETRAKLLKMSRIVYVFIFLIFAGVYCKIVLDQRNGDLNSTSA